MQKHKNILLIMLFWLPITLFAYFLNGIFGVGQMLLSMIIYFFIWYACVCLWRLVRGRETPVVQEIGVIFLKNIGIISLIIAGSLGSFAYYQNTISPATMPEYTLSNGEKTVIFQAMSHIGSEQFYTDIQKNITQAKQDDFVYFYEGVRPGSVENTQLFNQALGVELDGELYKNLSQLYGVTNQDNAIFLGLVNDQDYNVDLSLDDIMERYNAVSQPELSHVQPLDMNSEILEILNELSENQLSVLRYINQSLLNFMIKSEGIQEFMSDMFSNQELFAIILDDRNELLADAIIESEYSKIYTTYGLLHFKGVLELLQQHDPKWNIISQQNLYPIK